MTVILKKREKIARLGIATKGIVYCLIGLLTALAAFGLGGNESGSTGVLTFLAKQPFGKVLLIITAVGLLGFVFWRLYQTISDHDHLGTDLKGIVTRSGYGISAIFYATLAYTAISIALGFGSTSSGNSSFIDQSILQKTYGQVLFVIIAIALLGKAFFQFYSAYSNKIIDNINDTSLSKSEKKRITRVGKIGLTARGIVITIIAFLLLRSVFTTNIEDTGGKVEAFQYLRSEFGSFILGIVALGLLMYGVFMLILARHRSIHIS